MCIWINNFLSIKTAGYQKVNVTPYMHCLVYHVPDHMWQYGNLLVFSGQGELHVGESLKLFIQIHTGVEKHNDDAKHAYLSSNKWDATGDLIKTEACVECLQKYAVTKRKQCCLLVWRRY